MSSKSILVAVAAATLAAAVTGIALGTPPFGTSATPPVRGTIDDRIVSSELMRIMSRSSLDVATHTITLQPGGHSGWHGHEAPAFVIVKSGTVTSYDFADATCAPTRYSAGRAFVDSGEGHIARNEGPVPAEVVVTYLAPRGGALRTELPDPGTCPFSG